MGRRGRPDGWSRHREEQQRAWLRLSYEQRLRWLEQAMRFCRKMLGAAGATRARKAWRTIGLEGRMGRPV